MNSIYRILGISFALTFSILTFADSQELNHESRFKLANFDGFANAALQDISTGGTSFAGGAHWSPTYTLSEHFRLKGMLGAQTFRSTSYTGSSVYVVADYLVAVQYLVNGPMIYNGGVGAGTDLRSGGKTRAGLMLGGEYEFRHHKLLGFFDRALLNAHYYINSADLWVIHYGLGINL